MYGGISSTYNPKINIGTICYTKLIMGNFYRAGLKFSEQLLWL